MPTVITPKAEAPSCAYQYPQYAFEERLADGLIHVTGIILSIVGFVVLFLHPSLNVTFLPVLQIYAVCVISLFCFSAAYHMTPWPDARPMLRRFDQAAIYFKIAGTFTPLVFIIGSNFAFTLLTAIWLVATSGALIKLFTGDKLDRHTVIIYLGLGWSSALLVWPLFEVLPPSDVWLVIVGGLLYTIGVYFNRSETIKYSNAIWHGFVLAASICHFIAIADAVIV